MRYRHVLPVLLAAAVLPAGAQDRPDAGVAPRARVFSLPRVLEAARAPRAVLGLSMSTGNGLADTAGVLVADVVEGGPAARAGIAKGARLVEIDGVGLRMSAADAEDPMLSQIGSRRLTRALGEKKPGDEVRLRVADGKQVRTVAVKLTDRDSLTPRRAEAPEIRTREIRPAQLRERASLGVQVGATGSVRDSLGIFVMSVHDAGPAARAGIIEGQRIAAINGTDLRVSRVDAGDPVIGRARVQQLMRTLRDVKPGEEVELRVWQNGQYRTVRVRTVSADSLQSDRATTIIGDAFGGAAPLFFGRGLEGLEGELGDLRMELPRGFGQEIEAMLEEALRSARGSRDGAPRVERRTQRMY